MKNYMRLAISFLLLASPAAMADSSSLCSSLVGRYSKQINNNDTFDTLGLKIQYVPATAALSITYNSDKPPGQWNGWIESYIADGQSRAGDGQNTGKSYTATCKQNEISIVRTGMLIHPLVTTLTLSGDQLMYVSRIEGIEHEAHHAQLIKVE